MFVKLNKNVSNHLESFCTLTKGLGALFNPLDLVLLID